MICDVKMIPNSVAKRYVLGYNVAYMRNVTYHIYIRGAVLAELKKY